MSFHSRVTKMEQFLIQFTFERTCVRSDLKTWPIPTQNAHQSVTDCLNTTFPVCVTAGLDKVYSGFSKFQSI